MNIQWIDLSNPVAMWWIFLILASLVNIIAWSWTKTFLYKDHPLRNFNFAELSPRNLIWFSAAYVFGCAYRSFFIKADVQRICLFDTWFSSVFLGRTVATVAELCFVVQWAIVLRYLARRTQESQVYKFSFFIIPLIALAECFSWYAVITTHYLGNMIEESLWTLTYSLITLALFKLQKHFRGSFRYAINISIVCNILYVFFMIFVDVWMYAQRWKEDLASQKKLLTLWEGLVDLNTRWIVTHNIQDWSSEIPWMSLYFSFAVLVSIGLCYVPLTESQLKKHLSLTTVSRG